MVDLFANSEDPDHMPHSVASDLGLHCLPVTRLGVSGLRWVNASVLSVCLPICQSLHSCLCMHLWTHTQKHASVDTYTKTCICGHIHKNMHLWTHTQKLLGSQVSVDARPTNYPSTTGNLSQN